MDILSKVNSTIVEYDNIMEEMMNPSNVLDQDKLATLSKQKSAIQEVYNLSIQFVTFTKEYKELEALESDPDYAELIKEEKIEIRYASL